jgi:hypothetical protein
VKVAGAGHGHNIGECPAAVDPEVPTVHGDWLSLLPLRREVSHSDSAKAIFHTPTSRCKRGPFVGVFLFQIIEERLADKPLALLERLLPRDRAFAYVASFLEAAELPSCRLWRLVARWRRG